MKTQDNTKGRTLKEIAPTDGEEAANQADIHADCRFTTSEARIKLKSLRPSIQH